MLRTNRRTNRNKYDVRRNTNIIGRGSRDRSHDPYLRTFGNASEN